MTAAAPDPFDIQSRRVDPAQPPYLIAEVSANHEQDLALVVELINECAGAGFSAVKVQTYTADTMTLHVDRSDFRIRRGLWESYHLYDLYKEASLPWEWTGHLRDAAVKAGLDFFSTPFDESAVVFLEALDMPIYKVASFEVTDTCLLTVIGATRKPVILSTGLASKEEITEAMRVLRASGCPQIALLKCTSAYPAELKDLNLASIAAMRADFGVQVGYSDHTIGSRAASAAVSAGAVIIEKHVRACDRTASPDASFSLPSCQMKDFVDEIMAAFTMRGRASYGPTANELDSLAFRRSVIAREAISEGDVLSLTNLIVRRPHIGAEPRELPQLLGRRATRGIERGEGVFLKDCDIVEQQQ
jgi:pseudaminic acid synthase